MNLRIFFLSALIVIMGRMDNLKALTYPWTCEIGDSLVSRFTPPFPFVRVPVKNDSFQQWLRFITLKPVGSSILLPGGKEKRMQNLHEAVINTGQVFTDFKGMMPVVFLWAEYLYSRNKYWDIDFSFQEGGRLDFNQWGCGKRPVFQKSFAVWEDIETKDFSHECFLDYLKYALRGVFLRRLTWHKLECIRPDELEIGDIILSAKIEGQCAIVIDMAKHRSTGEKIFIFANSFSDAQDLYIMKNKEKPVLSPWFPLQTERFVTPEGVIPAGECHRIRF